MSEAAPETKPNEPPICERHGIPMYQPDCVSCHGDGETYGYREEWLSDRWEECWRCRGTGQAHWYECADCRFEDDCEDV